MLMKENEYYDEILRKFYEGETSKEEEEFLSEELTSGKMEDPYLSALEEIKIESRLNQVEEEFRQKTRGNRKNVFYLYPVIGAIAACIALVFMISTFDQKESSMDYTFGDIVKAERKSIADLNKDERLAYTEAKKALTLISVKFNKAQNHVSKIRMINTKNPIKM